MRNVPFITRAWVVTVKYKDDPTGARSITTRIHGRNPAEAELAYLREHPNVAALVIHHESHV